ncbi:ABC transporter permease [Danxiaibacter flavus]|uniref:ABC transporter permease n=1 Tax=Danxiaibacter flavus TaxID=3049108 RepID=A0ABV3ZB87_9BACT|nr:ABC transporter permease [Chitinophagaceae bacterium DXS]
MLRNYIKTAWRNLVKNKFYSLVNIFGLTAGLAVGILILLWVQYELSFDGFHKQSKNIYRLENMVGTGPSRQIWTVTAGPIGPLSKKQIPGVEAFARISYNPFYGLFRYQDKVFNEQRNAFADATLFSMFDFNLIKGNKANPFPDNNSIVITESTATKYFGKDEPVGKVISADNKINFTVTGVIHDFPKNSSIDGDMFFPISLLEKIRYADNKEGKNLENDFVQFDFDTYLLLKPGMQLSQLADKMRTIHLSVKSDDTDIQYLFLPLEKMHLYKADGSNGGIETVRMFTIIALLILVIACINYVNLSTARSMLRAKEVSLRKIVGAARLQLFFQFIIETALLFVLATGLALMLVYTLVPVFNQVTGRELVLNIYDVRIWKVIVCTILGTLIVSSIYPALLLSSFEPLKAIKGKISARVSNVVFRKVLVVVQFGFSMILITGTLIIGKQLSYIHSKELGYDKDHVLSMSMIDMSKHIDAVKADLLTQPGISNVTWADANIIFYGGQTGSNSWDGKQNGETLMISPIKTDKDFMSFFKMQLKEGSGFTGAVADSTHFILNETAVQAMRLKDPIGKRFKLWETEGTIIGVVKDFHFTSMRQKIKPAVFYYKPASYGQIYVKTTGKDAPKAIAAAEKEWKKYNADFPFTYAFLDDSFNRLYQSEQRTSLLFDIFAAIAVFISCLGLLGLAAYTAQVRTREIGIRKVLGASVSGIISMLASDFIRLVVIAILVAIPVAWYVMNKWLQDFAYKTNIGWLVFLAAGSIAVVIGILSISVQAVRSAIANPVKTLRSE